MAELGGSYWIILTILGPILLAAGLLYGAARWRRASLSQKVAGDEGARRLYRDAPEER
jgi:hypothetical protein